MKLWKIVLALAVVVGIGCVSYGTSESGGKYQYKAVRACDQATGNELEKIINDNAQAGWRLHSALPECIFEKQE